MNICIVFAQLERATIQKRVTDAYYSRCQRGFHMSGAAPYGFKLEPTTIQGIRTEMMIPDPATANIARLMFEMYAEPSTSFGDIARYFAENNIMIYGKNWNGGLSPNCSATRFTPRPIWNCTSFSRARGPW